MYKNLITVVSMVSLLLAAVPAFADGGRSPSQVDIDKARGVYGFSHSSSFGYATPKASAEALGPVKIVYLGEAGSKAQKSFIKTFATPANLAAIHSTVASDPEMLGYLGAKGIAVKNVIGLEKPFDGRTILFIR